MYFSQNILLQTHFPFSGLHLSLRGPIYESCVCCFSTKPRLTSTVKHHRQKHRRCSQTSWTSQTQAPPYVSSSNHWDSLCVVGFKSSRSCWCRWTGGGRSTCKPGAAWSQSSTNSVKRTRLYSSFNPPESLRLQKQILVDILFGLTPQQTTWVFHPLKAELLIKLWLLSEPGTALVGL